MLVELSPWCLSNVLRRLDSVEGGGGAAVLVAALNTINIVTLSLIVLQSPAYHSYTMIICQCYKLIIAHTI